MSTADQLATQLMTGLTHYQAGEFEQARLVYQAVLAVAPQQPDALHLMGVLAYQTGDITAGISYIQQAIAQAPDQPKFYHNLGNAYLQNQQIEAAIAAYQQAISLDGSEAEVSYHLGRAYQLQRQFPEAEAAYRQAIRAQPSYLEAYLKLGALLVQQQQHESALELYRSALEKLPGTASIWHELGNIYQLQSRWDEALKAYRQVIRLAPDFAAAYYNQGRVYHFQQNWLAAKKAYEEAIAHQPHYPLAWDNLGLVLRELDQIEEAIQAFETAYQQEPSLPNIAQHMGYTYELKGQTDTALKYYRQTLQQDAANVEALYQISRNYKYKSDQDPEWQRLQALESTAQNLPVKAQVSLHFALAKGYDDIKNYAQSFYHYQQANTLQLNTLPAYDEATKFHIWDLIRQDVNADYLATHAGLGYDSELPILIVGMPRSGSTLVEQILSSHPSVYGAGELTTLSAEIVAGWKISDRLGLAAQDPSLRHLTPRQRGFRYVQALKQKAGQAVHHVTDKMPENFVFLGLVHIMLPQAKIIHCQRHPVDNCLSCYQQLFSAGQEWSYDLGTLGRFYRHYQQLMTHWRSVLPPDRFLDVQYEAVVADLEGQAHRMLAYCGLDWSDDCLNFHQNQRPVQTASSYQVRQPIYSSSVEKWRRYEPYLKPLLDALAGQD